MSEIKMQLEEVFRDVFEDNAITIHENMTASDVKGWDSLNHVTLIVSVEKTFGVTFTTKEINSLKNVGHLIELVHRKKENAI